MPSPTRRACSSAAMPRVPDWVRNPTRPGSTCDGRQRGVQLDGGIGADEAERLRADQAHALAAGPLDEHPLRLLTQRTGTVQAGAHDDQRLHALAGALVDDREHLVGRHRDHGQVDLVRDVEHGRVARHAGDVTALRVDRVHGPHEVVGQQVAEDLVAEAAPLPTGADHRHRRRADEALDRPGLGPLRSLVDRGLGLGRRLEPQLHLDDAVAERAGGLEPDLVEHGQHAAVAGQHLRGQAPEPDLTGRHHQPLEQHGGQPPPVVGVVGDERDLGLVPAGPAVVAGHADDLAAEHGHQAEVVEVVDLREPVELPCAQPGHRAEVAEVDALPRLAVVERLHERGVGRPHRADVHGAPVGQRDIGLPAGRVGGLVRHAASLGRPP